MNHEQVPYLMDILLDAFDRNEIRSNDEIYSFNDSGMMKAYGYYDAGILVGGCFGWDIDGLFFVENLAIRKDLRDKGYGGLILEELKKKFKQMILEVEPPIDEMTVKRISFYKRHGFELSEEPYILPPLQKGGKPLPYKLMSYQYKVDCDTPNKIYRMIYQRNTSVEELKMSIRYKCL